MHVDLARTFLAIVKTGSFIRAASELNVAQTTISARMKLLEQGLGQSLFVRNNAGATLTESGTQFLEYAPAIVRLWEKARQQVATGPSRQVTLSVAAEQSLMQPLLPDWVLWLHERFASLALSVRTEPCCALLAQVASGGLDVAIVHALEQTPGLQVELIHEDNLILVTTDPNGRVSHLAPYVDIDWGAAFAQNLAACGLQLERSGHTFNLSWLALNFLLNRGGSGYFRTRIVEPYLANGALFRVREAPHFVHPIYAVTAEGTGSEELAAAIGGLKAVAKASLRQSFTGPMEGRRRERKPDDAPDWAPQSESGRAAPGG